MAKIKIVTDSTADIPQEIREQYGIEMVPLKIHFGEETLLDSVTVQADEFYTKLTQSEVMPTTSQPSPVEFLEVYKKLLEEDPEACILSIHISSALSGTYQSAVLAKSLLEEEGKNIVIVDSKSASSGLGILVLAAAEVAAKGEKSLEECENLVLELRNHTQVYFLLETLEYLQKGGRIGKASAVVGSLLHIKPILSIDQGGEVFSADKVRGQKKAQARIIDLLRKDFSTDQEVNITIARTKADSGGEELVALIEENFNVKNTDYTVIGPVIGTHTGPGSVAVFMSPA